MKTSITGTIQLDKMSEEPLKARGDRDDLWVSVIQALSSLRGVLAKMLKAADIGEARELAQEALEELDRLESEKTEIPPEETE